MAYQILNYSGEEIIPSVEDSDLTEMIEKNEFNYFEWDVNPETDILKGIQSYKEEDPDLDLSRFRIYKKIEE